MPPTSAPMSCRAHEVHAGVLAPQGDQAGRAVGGRDAEHDEDRGHHAEQAGLPAQLAGMPDRRARSHRLDRGAEPVAPLLVVLEHVVAGAGRRQQHRVARLGQPPRRGDHLVEVAARRDRRSAGIPGPARRSAPPRRTRPPPGSARAAARRAGVRLALVPPAEQQHERPVERRDGDLGRGHVGGLGVVDPEHAVDLAHRLHPVRDRPEGPEPAGDRVDAGSRRGPPAAPPRARSPRCGRRAAAAPRGRAAARLPA